MRILWLSQNVPFPPKTGVLQRNYNLLREAAHDGEVHLLAILKEDILPGSLDLAQAERELGEFCHSIDIVRLPIESSSYLLYRTAVASLFTRLPFTVNWARSRKMQQRIRQIVSESAFDIVHFDTISLAEYRHDVAVGARVLNHHNIESQLLERRTAFEPNPLRRAYYALEARKLRRYEAEVCSDFDMHFTVSELDGERLRTISSSASFEVVANGVDVDYFNPSEVPPDPGTLIMVSGMNWFPNRDAVLYMCERIWPLLSQKFPGLSWTVVGAGAPEALLELSARDRRVEVTGFVDDVRPYLQKAEVYICPMRDGGGTRLKLLDAFSMGKAVVATTMACEGISVTPERNVLIADDPRGFVKQIGRVLDDAQLRMKLGRAARRLAVEEYSWSVIGERMRRVYAELAGRSNAASAE